MSCVNGKLTVFVVALCMIIIFNLDPCDAGVKDKHKHKPADKHEKQHHKNSTTPHHKNSTSSHSPTANHTAPSAPPADIGWSLHNNPNHPPPAPNPHGYAVHHDTPAHPQQAHPGGHQVHSESQGGPHNQHNPNQPQTPPNQLQPGQQQDSGPSALGTGLGGLALGAIGGAAGGYLLSNALNSGGKSGEKSDSETTLAAATTLGIEPTLSSLAVDLNATTTESIPVVVSEVSSINGTDSENPIIEAPVEGVKVQNAPVESTTTVAAANPSSDLINSEQKTVDTTADPKEKSFGVMNRMSAMIFSFSVLSSFLLLVKF